MLVSGGIISADDLQLGRDSTSEVVRSDERPPADDAPVSALLEDFYVLNYFGRGKNA